MFHYILSFNNHVLCKLETITLKVQLSRNKDESRTLPVTVPDSIGKWTIDGFSLSPSTGLALGNTKELMSTKNFFLEFSLPQSVIQGEMVLFPLTVHNYLDYCVSVKLYFFSKN